jgi:hypothetical protein
MHSVVLLDDFRRMNLSGSENTPAGVASHRRKTTTISSLLLQRLQQLCSVLLEEASPEFTGVVLK